MVNTSTDIHNYDLDFDFNSDLDKIKKNHSLIPEEIFRIKIKLKGESEYKILYDMKTY